MVYIPHKYHYNIIIYNIIQERKDFRPIIPKKFILTSFGSGLLRGPNRAAQYILKFPKSFSSVFLLSGNQFCKMFRKQLNASLYMSICHHSLKYFNKD